MQQTLHLFCSFYLFACLFVCTKRNAGNFGMNQIIIKKKKKTNYTLAKNSSIGLIPHVLCPGRACWIYTFFFLSQMRLKKTHRRQRLFQSSAQMCNWANGKIALKNWLPIYQTVSPIISADLLQTSLIYCIYCLVFCLIAIQNWSSFIRRVGAISHILILHVWNISHHQNTRNTTKQ